MRPEFELSWGPSDVAGPRVRVPSCAGFEPCIKLRSAPEERPHTTAKAQATARPAPIKKDLERVRVPKRQRHEDLAQNL